MSKVVLTNGNTIGRFNLDCAYVSSIEKFKSIRPSIDINTRSIEILNDVIRINVKNMYSLNNNGVISNRFDHVDLSNMIIKYVSIYLNTGNKNVLDILYNILLDTFLDADKIKDAKCRNFIYSIYASSIDLVE